jgi:predicted PurR-regulated permease PerM
VDFGGSASLAKTLSALAKLATAALVIAALSMGRVVLMPIAFALVLSFILSSPMRWLQHRIPRWMALSLAMLVTIGLLGGVAYVLATQMDDLATQLGKYTDSMHRKLAAIQQGGRGPFDRAQAMFAKVTEGLAATADPHNVAVHVVPSEVSPLEHLITLAQPLAEPLVTVFFVLVLCAFLLARRDDVRNRLIRLVGPSNVTSTTRALDEGGQRISRYLLGQTMINVGFGVVVGFGLFWIGIPHAALWGGLAGLARFVPYLGVFISTLIPALLAFALFPGWNRTLLTVGLLVGLDAATNFAIEPLVIGHRTGVSSIALLISALFWAWLWGPLGLVLATPLTVSLSVLGRHVRAMRFLAVMLGDEQALGTEISFYQRLLARDEDEAAEIAQKEQVARGPTAVMDQIIIPGLVLAARDAGLKEITTADETFVLTWSRDIFEHLLRGATPAEGTAPVRALGIAAHGTGSELLLDMLAVVMAPEHGTLEVLAATTSVGDVIARVERLAPRVVCISALPPEGGPYARQICGRLKSRFPALVVVAFRPNEPGIDPSRAATRLREAGADRVVATLAEAVVEMSRLLAAPAERRVSSASALDMPAAVVHAH